jgi:hypothetical protein
MVCHCAGGKEMKRQKPSSVKKQGHPLETSGPLPENITQALSDNRFAGFPHSDASGAAIQAIKEKARRDREGHPIIPGPRFVSWQEQIETRALAGDAKFFRELAETFEFINSREMKVDDSGSLVCNFDNPAKIYILENWLKWEREKTKQQAQIAEVKEKFGMASSKFKAFAAIVKKWLKSPQ